jgi:hypothetical protein
VNLDAIDRYEIDDLRVIKGSSTGRFKRLVWPSEDQHNHWYIAQEQKNDYYLIRPYLGKFNNEILEELGPYSSLDTALLALKMIPGKEQNEEQ